MDNWENGYDEAYWVSVQMQTPAHTSNEPWCVCSECESWCVCCPGEDIVSPGIDCSGSWYYVSSRFVVSPSVFVTHPISEQLYLRHFKPLQQLRTPVNFSGVAQVAHSFSTTPRTSCSCVKGMERRGYEEEQRGY